MKRDSYTLYMFYKDQLIQSFQSDYSSGDDAFQNEALEYFKYACHETQNPLQIQLGIYETGLKDLIADMQKGLTLSITDRSVLGLSFLILWKFGRIPTENLIVLKNKKCRLKTGNKIIESLNDYPELQHRVQKHSADRFATRSRSRKSKKKRF